MRKLLLLLMLILSAMLAWGAEKLPFVHPLFSDNMVLQRLQPVSIYGWTRPGARVMVQLCDTKASGVADTSGRWQVTMGPFTAGGPYDLTIDGPEHVTLTNVMIGEVWLCAGQSNMELGLGLAQHGAEEIAKANHPEIRLFRVPTRTALTPQTTLENTGWEVCSPETAGKGGWGGFSAVAYYFGCHLARTLKVPVGLIQATCGGTTAEAWTSPTGLRSQPAFKPLLDRLTLLAAGKIKEPDDYNKAIDAWWDSNDPARGAWADPSLEEHGWTPVAAPLPRALPGLPDGPGIGWFRRQITLPAAWAGQPITLHLGEFDACDCAWFNGKPIGHLEQWNNPRNYQVPGALVKAGVNEIAVRVADLGGGGREFRSPLPLHAWMNADEKQTVSLEGIWKYRFAPPAAHLSPLPLQTAQNASLPGVLYNGIIAPLTDFRLAGIAWYQGEANTGRPALYRRQLPALITDWRTQFNQRDLPFLYVQIAGFLPPKDDPTDSNWAELREAQTLTAHKLPRVAMVITTDISDGDIHPKNKQEVGRRLGLAAQAVAYGQPVPYLGPECVKSRIIGHTIKLCFTQATGGLSSAQGPLTGFAIAGKDGKFCWATAVIQGNTVLVSSPEVPHPIAVRYAWADNPQGTLVNGAGLPAVPFRTKK